MQDRKIVLSKENLEENNIKNSHEWLEKIAAIYDKRNKQSSANNQITSLKLIAFQPSQAEKGYLSLYTLSFNKTFSQTGYKLEIKKQKDLMGKSASGEYTTILRSEKNQNGIQPIFTTHSDDESVEKNLNQFLQKNMGKNPLKTNDDEHLIFITPEYFIKTDENKAAWKNRVFKLIDGTIKDNGYTTGYDTPEKNGSSEESEPTHSGDSALDIYQEKEKAPPTTLRTHSLFPPPNTKQYFAHHKQHRIANQLK